MPTIGTSNAQRRRFAAQKVSVSPSLGQTPVWTYTPLLWCSKLEREIGPGMDKATLFYQYGFFREQLRDIDDQKLAIGQYIPEKLDRFYVKIELFEYTGDENGATPDIRNQVATETWYGVIETTEHDVHGTRTDLPISPSPRGDQTMTAYGILRELERTEILSARVEQAPASVDIGRGLPFNGHELGQYPEFGNRTAGAPYMFSEKPFSGRQWSASQAIAYLLDLHQPTDCDGNVSSFWKVGGQTDAVDWYEIVADTDRRNVKAVLDDLVDRRRLAGYWVDAVDNVGLLEFHLTLFTFSDVSVALPSGKTLPANPTQLTLDFEKAFDVTVVRLTDNSSHMADVVRCEGSRITSTFSISKSDHVGGATGGDIGLVPGWTAPEETKFKAAADPNDKERNHVFRHRKDLEDVYSRFVLDPLWEDKYISVADGLEYWVAPDLDELENITPLDVRVAYEATASGTGTGLPRPPLWIRGGQFLRYLLTKEEGEDEYQDPFAVFYIPPRFDGPLGEWEFGEHLDANVMSEEGDSVRRRQFAVRISMLDKGPGVRFRCRAQQLIATGRWPGASATHDRDNPLIAENNAIDFEDGFYCTVAIETDDFIAAEERITDCSERPDNSQDRVLAIRIKDARFDVLLPGTIIDIDADGQLVTSAMGAIIRDDRLRLQDIAKVAAKWYAVRRQSLHLVYKALTNVPDGTTPIQLGNLITDVGATYNDPDVNSVVSSIEYDFKAGTTTIETSFSNMDFSLLQAKRNPRG